MGCSGTATAGRAIRQSPGIDRSVVAARAQDRLSGWGFGGSEKTPAPKLSPLHCFSRAVKPKRPLIRCSQKALLCERLSRAGFEIPLEPASRHFVGDCDI